MSPLLPRALRKIFNLDDRQRAYQLSFRSPSGAIVFDDLAQFCRLGQTTFDPAGQLSIERLEGRREVLLRIMQHMELSRDELLDLFGGVRHPVQPPQR